MGDKKGVSFDQEAKAAKTIPKLGQGWNLPPRYQIRQAIGTGSYGAVCEAMDSGDPKHPNGKLVAVKRVERLFEDLIDCKRILREIAILNRLQHGNIVRILDMPRPDRTDFDQVCIIMEICDSDMKKLCRTPVHLSELHVKTLLYNLLVGLKFLHSAGVYHRDLKPANVLVNQDCSVKICDFGLSRAVDMPDTKPLEDKEAEDLVDGGGDESRPIVPHTEKLKRNLTRHVVTRWYRAPELILLQENYTEAIDMWSVGCIYAELQGMLSENLKNPQDRGPLFPGGSCFPLSPDNKHKNDYKYHTRGKQEQLNVIFNLLGSPAAEECETLERDDAKRYIKCFAERKGTGLTEKFPGASKESLEILDRMLKFSPSKRITVEQALCHPLFTDIRSPDAETTAKERMVLEFEAQGDLGERELRENFLKEIDRLAASTS